MAKKRLGISTFDLNIKFESKEEAYRYAKRLIEFIRYTCKKNKWLGQALICISNTKGSSSYVYYEHSGKVGRPKIVKEKYLGRENDVSVDWHIHILLVSQPVYAFRDKIKNYIDKNWDKCKDTIIYNNSRVYKKDSNIKKVEYFINQADKILFCNCDYTNKALIPNGYSLKDLYNAYMNSRTALKYCRSTSIEKRLELEEKYNDIIKLYLELTKEQDKKMVDKFMKEMQLIKIAENYERIESNNKVQKDFSIRRERILEDTGF